MRQDAALAVVVGRDGVEDRRQPIRGLAVERQRRRQQLRDLRVVERRGHAARRPATPSSGSSGVCIICMTTCGSSCAAAAARLLMTSGSRSGDITDDDAGQVAEAARTVAACEVIIGEPSSGALRRHDGRAPDRRCRRRCRRCRAAAAARARRRPPSGRRRSTCTIERQRSSRLAGSATSPSLAREQLLVVDLLEDDRRVAFVGPDLRRAAAPPALRGIERQHAQQRVERRRTATSPTK